MEAGEGGGFVWSGAEGWGENADNCNNNKIKKILNKQTNKVPASPVSCVCLGKLGKHFHYPFPKCTYKFF